MASAVLAYRSCYSFITLNISRGWEDWRSDWSLGVMLGSMGNEKLTNTVTYALPGDSWRALRTGSVVDVVSMRQERSVDGGGAS